MPVQIIVRDIYGAVVFNQVSPSLPVACLSIAIFLKMWGAPISQILLVTPETNGGFTKKTFKLKEGGVLVSSSGEKIFLPEAPDPDEDYSDEDGYLDEDYLDGDEEDDGEDDDDDEGSFF